jgi:hypothetical protein
LSPQLTFEYPAWFLIFCVLAGLGIASLLYFKDRSFNDQSKKLNLILGALRWAAISLICFLLLGPLFKSLITEIKKPVILLAIDRSESMPMGLKTGDSLRLAQGMASLKEQLGKDYDVRPIAFGETVRDDTKPGYTDRQTNLADVLSFARDEYDRRNLGAIILATDGIVNDGPAPQSVAEKLGAPIYSIALGDTIPKKDIGIKRVFHNNIVYLGDQFTIQVDVEAFNCGGSSSRMQVERIGGGAMPKTASISIAGNDYFSTQAFTLEATTPGIQHYRVSVSGIAGESNPSNNVKDFYIEVLDARQKILLLAHSPHPDIAALNQVLSNNKNYQVTTALATDAGLKLAEFDLVVLHQIPAKGISAEPILAALNQANIPRLFFVGSQSDIAALNGMQKTLNIRTEGQNTNEVQPIFDKTFQAFVIDGTLLTDLPNYNPVTAPFGDVNAVGNAQVLLNQKIGKIETKYPLLAFRDEGSNREAVFLAEHIWRWRLFDFLQHKSHEQSNELFGKIFQYLTSKDDKRKFRVTLDKNIFKENEQVIIGAELYNDNFELINSPDAQLVLTDENKKEFKYTFNKTTNAYTLNANVLAPGRYSYKGSLNFNGVAHTATGEFSVQAIQAERFETVANHVLLQQLAGQSGGSVVGLDSVLTLADRIRGNQRIQPVMYQTSETSPLLNKKWLFALLLLLLGAEWFCRRFFGAY